MKSSILLLRKFPQRLKHTILTILTFLCISNLSMAAEIKGHVYDKKTKEQIIGAYVAIKSLTKAGVTELDGSYNIKDLQPGTYLINCSYLGYNVIDSTITISDKNEVIKVDLYLYSSTKELKQVEIKGHADGGTDAYANNAEKNADYIQNILSAHSIQISPDVIVSDVMQRISGVSMERGSGGEGQYAIIRGMDRRYNTTLVNGVKIPSPDDKERYVPLDIFPAELLDRLEVIKSLTPSMEGDATGGVINMVMKNAPDKLLLDANFGIGYSSIFQNRDFEKFSTKTVSMKSPSEIAGPGSYAPVSAFPYQNLLTNKINNPYNINSSLTFGDRFFKDKLGVIVSGSYQNTYDGYNSKVLYENYVVPPSPNINTPNIPTFSDIYDRQYSTLSQRLGVESKIDYKINKNNIISLFGTYLQLNEYRVRSTNDSLLGGYTMNNYDGVIGYHLRTETRSTLQSIYNITLQGKHNIVRGLSADWSLVTSQAKKNMPDFAEFAYEQRVQPVYDPGSTTTGSLVFASPNVSAESREWEHNTDKDLAAYYNLHYKFNIPYLTEIDAGGLYRHKNRDNYDNQYSLAAADDPGSINESYTSISNSKFTFFPANGALGLSADPGIYTAKEDVLAYYGQAHISLFNRLTFLGGARVENTIQSYNSSLAPANAGQHASYNYIDFLPSLQGKYQITETSALRFSYFRSIYRPAFADLIPFPSSTVDEVYQTIGYPYLRHSVIENYDVRYELFPKGLDQFMIGAFYKNIYDPVEYIITQGKSIGLQLLEPGNFGTATNYGIELVARKYFGSFGVAGNYTYTHSDIFQNKSIYVYDVNNPTAQQYQNVPEHRPLEGQAANIGNIALLYKNVKNKIEAQIAFVYTGDRINTISFYKDQDVWQKPTLSLDFSANVGIGKHFIVYLKAKNLLNSGVELYIKQHNQAYNAPKLPFQESPNYYTVERDYYYSSVLVGVRYKLF